MIEIIEGITINPAAILLGILIGIFYPKDIPQKTQNWIHTLLAAFILYIAGRIVIYEALASFSHFLISGIFCWLCLILGAALFRRSPIPQKISALAHTAKTRFISQAKKHGTWETTLLIGTAFFSLTPLTFAASALFGCYADPRLFIAKGVMDLLGVFVFTRTLKIKAIAVILPVIVLQFILVQLFGCVASTHITTGMTTVGLVIAYLCLHSSLILLGWNKTGTLFSYVPALFLALIVDSIW